MTELFDPPIDKYDLPKHDVSSGYCLALLALTLTPVAVGISIANGDIDLRSMISSTNTNDQKPESFCENLKHRPSGSDTTLHRLVDRTFCNSDSAPNPTP